MSQEQNKYLVAIVAAYGVVIRRHRLAKGFSQAELGKLVGLSARTVQRLEAGTASRTGPKLSIMMDLGRAMKVPPGTLVMDAEKIVEEKGIKWPVNPRNKVR